VSVYATFREIRSGTFCSVLLTAIWIRNGILSPSAWYDQQHGGAPVRIHVVIGLVLTTDTNVQNMKSIRSTSVSP
jgi:hypothetical protein